MRNPKALAIVFCVGMFLLTSTLKADEWNKKTTMTFSGPVLVGKHTQLPAGTYVFKLMDSDQDRNIVQIFNADMTHIYATIIAIPDYQQTPSDKTVIKFVEANGSDLGIPIKEWFYPGDNFGQEFKVVVAPQVAEVEAPPAPEQAAAPAPEEPQPEAAPAPQEEAPAAAAPTEEPAAPQTEESAPAPTEQPVPAPEATAPTELPQTASQTPLVGLIGMLCLAAAASLRIFLKISA